VFLWENIQFISFQELDALKETEGQHTEYFFDGGPLQGANNTVPFLIISSEDFGLPTCFASIQR
jgi:hypothetical protein